MANQGPPSYTALEPTALKDLGVDAPTFQGNDTSFLSASTFVYTLILVACIGAAFYKFTVAGIVRMEASEANIRKSNEMFKRASLGLLGVFGLFLLLFTINKDLVMGDIDLSGLRSGESRVSSQPSEQGGGSAGGTSRSCGTKEALIEQMQSGNSVCGGSACTALAGCPYQEYIPIIKRESGGDTKLEKMAIVILCQESHGNKIAQNDKNKNGTFDCGLMQINQATPCDGKILDPNENIRRGVALIKQKISAASRVYQNVPQEANVFASYNCCGNGDNPISASNDCTQSSGFPSSIPKWACPINPGNGPSNMCSVKSYACNLTTCLKEL